MKCPLTGSASGLGGSTGVRSLARSPQLCFKTMVQTSSKGYNEPVASRCDSPDSGASEATSHPSRPANPPNERDDAELTRALLRLCAETVTAIKTTYQEAVAMAGARGTLGGRTLLTEGEERQFDALGAKLTAKRRAMVALAEGETQQ